MQNFENNYESTNVNPDELLQQDDVNKIDFSMTLLELGGNNISKKQEEESGDENSENLEFETVMKLSELNNIFPKYGLSTISEAYYNVLLDIYHLNDGYKIKVTKKKDKLMIYDEEQKHGNDFSISSDKDGNILFEHCRQSLKVKYLRNKNGCQIDVIYCHDLIKRIIIKNEGLKNQIKTTYDDSVDYWEKTVEKGGIVEKYTYPNLNKISPNSYDNETIIWLRDGVLYEIKLDFSKINVDLSENYIFEGWSVPVQGKDGTYTVYPRLVKKKLDSVDKLNRSEQLDRRVEVIRVSHNIDVELLSELYLISDKLGFKVELVSSGDQWIEDCSIRRCDGKILLPPDDVHLKDVFSEGRDNISIGVQGAVAKRNTATEFSKNLEEHDIVRGKSYLEGGNVLNTIVNGKPGAIVGDESIGYSLQSMGLDDTVENREIVKKQIAEDLGIEYEQLTFIPQIDFHIDMAYRPLQNGTIAVPDYSLGIEMFSKFVPNNFVHKQEYIDGLKKMQNTSAGILQKAEDQLEKGGYKITKIPSFTIPDYWYDDIGLISYGEDKDPIINFMNGVGGTTKNGTTYYITNTSTFPLLDKAMKKYLKKNGIDDVYYLNTQNYLYKNGGFDCLTQEI